MLLDERDERIDLRLGVADAWEGEQVDGDLSAGGRHQLRALIDVLQPIADGLRRVRHQVPGCELSNLRRGGGEGETGLGGVDVAPLLGDATQAGGITRRRDWDRAFAAANEDVLGRQAPVVRRTGLEV